MKYILSAFLSAAVTFPALAVHDGAFLNKITDEYVTPHHKFYVQSEKQPIRALFILSRSGARDAVELGQRIPLQADHLLTPNHAYLAVEDMYESAIAGTTVLEKKRELAQKLETPRDLYVIGNFDFIKLPEDAQFKILSAVRDGAGLLIVQPTGLRKLPFKKLYQEELPAPSFLTGFPFPNERTVLKAWKVGKGRVVHLAYGAPSIPQDLTLTAPIPMGNTWRSQYENAIALAGLASRFAAGRETEPESPVVRIRDSFNNIVTPPYCAGTLYKDELGRNGGYRVSKISVESPVGTMRVTAPEVVRGEKSFAGSVSFGKPAPADGKLRVELVDSPYGRIFFRKDVPLKQGAQKVDFTVEKADLPTIAGTVRVSILGQDGRPNALEEQFVFFPDRALDDYPQLGWDTISDMNGPLFVPQLLDRLGWTLGLTHPNSGGKNARDMAILNQKMVPYTVRIGFQKSKTDGVAQYSWFFLPKERAKEVEKLKGDECFYRPEVQELWKAGIEHRMTNLPKYGPAIYNLGDENFVDTSGGYGPSDLQYFREFLRKKYGSIEQLNHNWRTSYKDFSEVLHIPQKTARDSGNYPAWGDHRSYMETMYADCHAFLADEIRKYDPGALVGAEGSVPGDLEKTIGTLEYWGPYSDTVEDEVLRSFGGDRVRMLWWGGYPGSHGGRGPYPMPLLGDLVRGTVNGNAWFAANIGSNHSAFGCDMTLADYVKRYLPYFDSLRNGLAQLLIRNPMSDEGIYFYWSHPSNLACKVNDACVNPTDGLTPLIRYAYRNGRGFEFISARTLDRLKKAKVVFLCGASALSDKECVALLDFVKNGGILIADVNPAVMNENLRTREANPLEPLFGKLGFNDAKKPELKPVTVPGFKAALSGSTGNYSERNYGKGKAILLNFMLSSAVNTADKPTPFDRFIDGFLPAPIFKVAPGLDENAVIRIRHGNGFDVIAATLPPARLGEKTTVALPGKRFFYLCGEGFAGEGNTLTLDFAKSPFLCYSIFSEKQKEPDFSIAGGARGGRLAFSGPALVSGRVYRLELTDPAGQIRRTFVFDRAEKAPVIRIAYNEPAGRWKAVLTDIATGLRKTTNFEVTP